MDKLSFTIYSLATDLSWGTHYLFLVLVDKKRKRLDYDKDDRLKARLRLMFLRRLETPLGPVKTVDEVLTQLIADIRAIQEEFVGSNETFMAAFIFLVERLRPKMLQIVRIRKRVRNPAPDPNLHQRTASIFRQLFFQQVILFLSFYRRRWSLEYIRKLDKLATDLSWDTHCFFFVIVEEKRKKLNFNYDPDNSLKSLAGALYKTRLRNMFRSRLETPLGPVHSVDQVLPQLIADIREILEEFDGPTEAFMINFNELVQSLRAEMFEIVRIHELIENGDSDPKLHQRAASRFRKMFFAQLILFLSLPAGIN